LEKIHNEFSFLPNIRVTKSKMMRLIGGLIYMAEVTTAGEF
jgi:hypothetical protein